MQNQLGTLGTPGTNDSPQQGIPHDLDRQNTSPRRKPEWLKVRPPAGEGYLETKEQLGRLKLHTVCEEARCPNIAECWSHRTATIMLLGDVCTRGCRFCAVKSGKPGGVVDTEEPAHVGTMIGASNLAYVVLTSVDRDDLPDGGAGHFAKTILEIKQRKPEILCEVLVSDFQGDLASVEALVRSGLEVYGHNVETVRRLTPRVRDRRATYEQSLMVLREAKHISQELDRQGLSPNHRVSQRMYTKSSIQLGHGETEDEVLETLQDLRKNNVDIVTFGQYLQPTPRHLPVVEFIRPEAFRAWEVKSRELGFLYAASGPLVRSSYRAGEYFISNLVRGKEQNGF
jgi:lipoic acid synthetase